MGRVLLNTNTLTCPQTARIDNEALAVWISSLTHCARTKNDGHLTNAEAASLCRLRNVTDAADVTHQLEAVRLWVREADGFYVPDLRVEAESSESPARRHWRKIRSLLSDRIFCRDNYKCRHCGRTDRLTVDHIVPLARGGTSDDSNLQTLCVSCNSRKGDRLEIVQ